MNQKQWEELQELVKEQSYNIIYVDFANPKEIRVSHSLNDFTKADWDHYIKFYIFNDTFMRVYTRKAPKVYDCMELHKDDFEEGYLETAYFIDYSSYDKLWMRIGKVRGTAATQYMHFE